MLEKSSFKNRSGSVVVSENSVSNIVSTVEKIQDVREKLNELNENLFKVREAVQQTLIEAVQDFKNECDERNINNLRKIVELRAIIPLAKKEFIERYVAKVDELELKNCEMKERLEAFVFEGKGKWISFKNEYKHDMCGLDKAFNDFTIENEI